MTKRDDRPYASRAGRKLEHALDAFAMDVAGLTCADLGCNVGGFTDCLLQRGAAHVFAVDTGYGVLAYPLRMDDRVTVMERTNALHVDPPAAVDLVVVDLGWTRQHHAVPAALRWLTPGGRIISLIKPHYEQAETGRRGRSARGGLNEAAARQVFDQVLDAMPALGVTVLNTTTSPLTGAKSSRRGPGNAEYLALLAPGPSAASP